jgi:hypothetical protein
VGTATNPALSCKAINDEGVFTSDDVYWIQPDDGTAFEVYCSMTYEDGGWALLSRLGPCSEATISSTVTPATPCSHLSAERVSRIASVGTDVMLRTGSGSHQYSLSTNSGAVEALRTTNSTWHNGATWSGGWYWAVPTCSTEDANGWPNMYVSCGSGDGVHWIQAGGRSYFHQRVNNSGVTNGEVATTWVR